MTKESRPISFDEFSNNITGFFEQVIHEKKAFIIGNDNGEQVILKPVPIPRRKKRVRTEADHQAFLASFGSWKDEDVDTFLRNNYDSRKLNT